MITTFPVCETRMVGETALAVVYAAGHTRKLKRLWAQRLSKPTVNDGYNENR